jgi:A/G-specific adenine glycosylase
MSRHPATRNGTKPHAGAGRSRAAGHDCAQPAVIPAPEPVPIADFAPRLLAWFDHDGRHDLPWQHPRSAYRVWLSEIMLQQTQVAVVIPYFARFVAALPDLPALASAPLDRVLALWSGLGYYARARHLHASARRCVQEHGGELPRDADALQALPGIGRSTAAAILAQAHGERHAILDGNVKRVLARLHGIEGWPGMPAIERRLWLIAESLLPDARMADYTQAQMDFGATLCTRHDPACMLCPFNGDCLGRRDGRETMLPTPKPSRALPQREGLVLWLTDTDGRVLLQRRPPTGVWAALWSLPQHPEHDGARRWLAAHATLDFDHAEALPVIEHGFSHYRLRLQPLRWRAVATRLAIGDNPDLAWFTPDEIAGLGLPAPIRRLLDGQDH